MGDHGTTWSLGHPDEKSPACGWRQRVDARTNSPLVGHLRWVRFDHHCALSFSTMAFPKLNISAHSIHGCFLPCWDQSRSQMPYIPGLYIDLAYTAQHTLACWPARPLYLRCAGPCNVYRLSPMMVPLGAASVAPADHANLAFVVCTGTIVACVAVERMPGS